MQLDRNANTQTTPLSNSGLGSSKLCVNKPSRFSSFRTTDLAETVLQKLYHLPVESHVTEIALRVTKDNGEKDVIQNASVPFA